MLTINYILTVSILFFITWSNADCNGLYLWCPYDHIYMQGCAVGMCWDWGSLHCQTCSSVMQECTPQCGRLLPSDCDINAWAARADGCSIPVPLLNEAWNGVFGQACNIHDICYASPGAGQGNCDDQFLANMLAICNTQGIGQIGNVPCTASALMIYTSVSTSPEGKDAYDNGQEFAAENCRRQFDINGVINCGGSIQHTISPYEKHILKIDLQQDYGMVYWESCTGATDFDTHLYLYNQEGVDDANLIVECDDCNNHAGPCGTITDLTNFDMSAGIYYLGVGGHGSASGTYTLGMECV